MERKLVPRRLCWAGGILLLLPAVAGATLIATGPDPSADGYLSIGSDGFGAWSSTTFGGQGDIFNPSGAPVGMEAAFTSGFFLFAGGNQRELLTSNGTWQGVFPADTSLSRSIITPNAASDTNGDTVDDMLTSAFGVSGGATNLVFGVTQHVSTFGPGVSFVRQDYTVTNDGIDPITFSMVRAFDGDILWDGDFANDEVGTSMHGAGLGPFVFEQDPGDPGITAVTLSGLAGGAYYGGKKGVTPAGGPPAYNYGTDTQVWDAYGVPTSWANHIAGVGYNTNGVSGPAPPGSTAPEDGFIGLGFLIDDLAPNETRTITVFHTYGQNTPVPEPSAIALLLFGAACLRRR